MVERFLLTIYGEIVEPNLAAAVPLLHHVEQSKTVESCAIGFVARIEMADGNLVIECHLNASRATIALRIVTEGPCRFILPLGKPLSRVRPLAGSRITEKPPGESPPARHLLLVYST